MPGSFFYRDHESLATLTVVENFTCSVIRQAKLYAFPDSVCPSSYDVSWDIITYKLGFTMAVQCVCKLMSSANRQISFFNYSQPPCPILFKPISIVLRQISPINTLHGVLPQGHLQGQKAIIKTHNFSLLKETYRHVLFSNICRIYMSCHILFKGQYFVL